MFGFPRGDALRERSRFGPATRPLALVAALAIEVALLGCATQSPRARSWEESDSLFRSEPRWLGGDAASSVDLGGDRVLWLFGDSFVATSAACVRGESKLVRNSVALQVGRDPLRASMRFGWGVDAASEAPASFFADEGERWHWPLGGALVDGVLVVFLAVLRATPGEGLGFATDGWRIALVDDPSAPLESWSPRRVDPPPLASL